MTDSVLQFAAFPLILAALFVLRIVWHIGSVISERAAKLNAEVAVILHDAGLLNDVSKR